MRSVVTLFGLVLMLALPAQQAQADVGRILVMGDSFMTSNGTARKSFSHVLSGLLGARVTSTAVSGARHLYGLPITGALGLKIGKQYRQGNWDYVVMNGGGNDLLFGCGCGKCSGKMARLISPDGRSGVIPSTVALAQQSGAHVIYVGYLRSPGRGSPIERCRAVGDQLEARIATMAQVYGGITFVSLADMVPYGDGSFHAADMIHPSFKGSEAAARRVAAAIKSLR